MSKADERDRLAERVSVLEAVLQEIADEDWVENCLDPQRAARIARAVLSRPDKEPLEQTTKIEWRFMETCPGKGGRWSEWMPVRKGMTFNVTRTVEFREIAARLDKQPSDVSHKTPPSVDRGER